MTPFLIATLAALLVGGILIVLYRENRRRFRQALVATVAAVLLVGGYVWMVTSGIGHRGEAGLVTATGLTLTDVAGSYRLSGTLVNGSTEQSVSAVPLTLVIEDCRADNDCRELHRMTQTVAVAIPPGASRPLVRVYPVTGAHPAHTLRWRVEVGRPQVYVPAAR